MTRLLLALFLLAAPILAAPILAPAPAWAISDPAEALADPAAEHRAVAVGRQLRCMVCQNESIEDSGADLAKDLRYLVRQRIGQGDSDDQVVAWMVARYGDFVRLRPPLNAMTAVLWASPVLAVLLGLGVAVWRRGRPPPPAPLTAAEQRRLKDLLQP